MELGALTMVAATMVPMHQAAAAVQVIVHVVEYLFREVIFFHQVAEVAQVVASGTLSFVKCIRRKRFMA